MLSFMCRCFVFPLSPGGVPYLASATAAVFASPGGVTCLAGTTAAIFTSPGGVTCLMITCSGIQDLFNTATLISNASTIARCLLALTTVIFFHTYM